MMAHTRQGEEGHSATSQAKLSGIQIRVSVISKRVGVPEVALKKGNIFIYMCQETNKSHETGIKREK